MHSELDANDNAYDLSACGNVNVASHILFVREKIWSLSHKINVKGIFRWWIPGLKCCFIVDEWIILFGLVINSFKVAIFSLTEFHLFSGIISDTVMTRIIVRTKWSMKPVLISVVLSGWECLSPPGRDTNPSLVSSQQTLVLIYLPRKDGKPS